MFFSFSLRIFRINNSSSPASRNNNTKGTQCVRQTFSVQCTPLTACSPPYSQTVQGCGAELVGAEQTAQSLALAADQRDVFPGPSGRGLPELSSAVSDWLQCTVYMSRELPDVGGLGQLEALHVEQSLSLPETASSRACFFCGLWEDSSSYLVVRLKSTLSCR